MAENNQKPEVGKISLQKIIDAGMFSPKNIRVLAVDSNIVSLRYLVELLRKCGYKVTSTTVAEEALMILRENRSEYQIVITDVVRTDIDGFKLLEIIALELDLPVIMVSAEESKSSIMKGIRHGARDYLLKPVRMQEIKNIWQHVVRKRMFESSEQIEDQSRNVSEKKIRVTWSPELHSKFVDAILLLEKRGEKVHPKRIQETMNVEGLSRENIASHLQKHRSVLRKRDIRTDRGSLCDDHNPSSVPSTSYFNNMNQTFLKPSQQNILQKNAQTSRIVMQQDMLNNMPANPGFSINMLRTGNHIPTPEFKNLNFPASSSLWKLPNEYMGMSPQFISSDTPNQMGMIGNASFSPFIGAGKTERASFQNLCGNGTSNVARQVLMSKDDEAIFIADELFNYDAATRP